MAEAAAILTFTATGARRDNMVVEVLSAGTSRGYLERAGGIFPQLSLASKL